MHRTLARQLRKLSLDPLKAPDTTAWVRLLELVSATYSGADDDRYTLERSISISSAEMRTLHDELSAQARVDALTGMPNRTALRERLSTELSAARERSGRVALLFIDLDGFKGVNDHFGHAAGDVLLVRTADRMRGVLRGEDVVARLGGDEFVVLFGADLGARDAASVARRIVAAVEAPMLLDGQETAISASVGVALSDGDETPESLLRRADLAMYEAKARGHGLVTEVA